MVFIKKKLGEINWILRSFYYIVYRIIVIIVYLYLGMLDKIKIFL